MIAHTVYSARWHTNSYNSTFSNVNIPPWPVSRPLQNPFQGCCQYRISPHVPYLISMLTIAQSHIYIRCYSSRLRQDGSPAYSTRLVLWSPD